MKDRIRTHIQGLKPIDWVFRIFWLSMLAGHLPLSLRSFLRLQSEGATIPHLASFLTLLLSCLFFGYKLLGYRLIARRPTWRRTVVFFILGAMLHILVFSPSLAFDRAEFLAELTGCVAFSVIVGRFLAMLAGRLEFIGRVRSALLGHSPNSFWLDTGDRVLQPVLSEYLHLHPHRGPPSLVTVS